MMRYTLCLGGNIGDVPKIFSHAVDILAEKYGRVISQSSLYVSPAWGFEAENDFLNQIIVLDSPLAPQILMDSLLSIESQLGRVRSVGCIGYQSRVVDIDIIFAEGKILDSPSLIIPHPRMQLRRFVLEPLCEIDAGFVHPILGKTCQELLAQCEDISDIRKLII